MSHTLLLEARKALLLTIGRTQHLACWPKSEQIRRKWPGSLGREFARDIKMSKSWKLEDGAKQVSLTNVAVENNDAEGIRSTAEGVAVDGAGAGHVGGTSEGAGEEETGDGEELHLDLALGVVD